MTDINTIPAGYKLLQAHLILRHGDRAPTSNIYSSPPSSSSSIGIAASIKATAETSYWTAQMPSPLTLSSLSTMFPVNFLDTTDTNNFSKLENTNKNYPFGLLTTRGLFGTFSLGAALRKLYIEDNDLLPKQESCTANPHSISARSTAMKRTVQSCQSVLHGFCAPSNSNELGVVQVNVETGKALEMPNFGFMREKCPALIKQWQASLNTEHSKQVEQDTTPLVQELATFYPYLRSQGMSHTSKLLKAFDHFKTHQAHGLETAQGTRKETMSELKTWARDHFWRLYANQHAIQTTLMMTRILTAMENRVLNVNDRKVPRLCIYSGHDTTVMPTLATLMLVNPTPDEEWPPYGAHVRLELLHKEYEFDAAAPKHFVRIVYQEKSIIRSMDEFKALILSQRTMNFVEECKDSDASEGINPFQDNR
tara:strand:+ start:59 stop:1327 length:1269 start_codon:yes stop_codon:yes gene_type:complete